MDFAGFIVPFDEQRFVEQHFDQLPLHIAGGQAGDRARLVDFETFLGWLELVPQWQTGRLKMIMDSRPVAAEHYSATREAAQGAVFRPDRVLVESMMALGASAVADGVEDISADVRRCCAMLGRRFAAKPGANLYVSHSGVQAFASHCDPHEVFAVQCEGRKLWRIYGARADSPTQATLLTDQSLIDKVKGPVIMEVMMEPGDLLYIPRGFYHDAMAQGGRSIHLTFAVQPLHGLGALDLLRDLAMTRPAMRRYIPSAAEPEALAAHLEVLNAEIAELLRSRAFCEDIAVRQRTMASPIAQATGADDCLLVRTSVPCSVKQPLDGSYLEIGSHRRDAGLLSDTARWIFAQTAFTPAQCIARFCHHPASDVEALIDDLLRIGALERHPMP